MFGSDLAQRSNRERLIEGAVECLKTKGYGRTTARDIATAADANLASIGYHFGSKEALLNEAVIRNSEAWAQRLAEAAFAQQGPEAETPLARMAGGWVAALETFPAERSHVVSFLEAVVQAQWSEEMRERMAEHMRDIRTSVAALVASMLGPEAEAKGANPKVVASFLMSVVDGLMIQWLLDPAETPEPEELIPTLGAALRLAQERVGDSGAGTTGLTD